MHFLPRVRRLCGRRTLALSLSVASLILVISRHGVAQDFPGENDPIDNPDRLTQFPDDELAVFSFQVSGSGGNLGAAIQEFSPNPDYTAPAGPFSLLLDIQPKDAGEENIFSNAGVTRGRFTEPSRDALVALTKTSATLTDSASITWAVQELIFVGGPPPTVPTLTFTAPVFPDFDTDINKALDSPGAIAAGDLDRVVDKDGNYHDEIAIVTERYPGGDSNLTYAVLSVIDYAAKPQTATVNATIQLPSAMAYPLNISTLRPYQDQSGQAGRPRYPGMLAVTTGDFDGDGTKDIAVVALTYDGGTGNNNLQVYFYEYAPGYTHNPPQPGSLSLRGSTTVASGPDDPTKPKPLFHGPLSVDRGDVDGDGKDEVVVAFHDNATTSAPGLDDIKWHADLRLVTVAFDPMSKAITVTGGAAVTGVEAWYDGLNDPKSTNDNPPPRYLDIRVATGLFKFNPELGYPLTRRQIALAYGGLGKLNLELWEWLGPGAPGNTQGKTPILARYSTAQTQFCLGVHNSFSLVAGNFAGVKAKSPDTPPVWGLALGYEPTQPKTEDTVALYRVDQGVDWQKGVFPLTAASRLNVDKLDTICGRYGRNVLAVFDYDGDSLRLGAPVHFVLNDVQHFDYMLQEPPKHVDYLPNAVTTCTSPFAYTCNGIINVSEFDGFNIEYGTSNTNTVTHEVRKDSSWSTGGSVAFSAQNTVGENGGIEQFETTFDFKTKVGYDYDEHKESYKGHESGYTVSQNLATSADDALSYQIRTTDIWRYRIYGETNAKDPTINAFYEVALPRALCSSSSDPDPANCNGQGVAGGGKAHSELYQPWHENWNILSYPDADTEFHPTDIGPWTRAKCSASPCSDTNCTPNKDDPTKVDCTTPIAPPNLYSWDGTEQHTSIALDSSLTSGSTTEWSSKFSEDVNLGIGWEFEVGDIITEEGLTGCLDFDFHSDQSWGQLSTASTTATMTTDIKLNKPPGPSTYLYNFFPTLYLDTKGAMRAVHSVTLPTTGFWQTFYERVDPALNLPNKFDDTPDANFKQFNVLPTAKEMRGFLLRNGNTQSKAYGTLLSCAPVRLNDPVLNNQVLLEARVYNYSVATRAPDVPVRFDIVELDNGHECSDATACLTRRPLATVTATCTNPYNVQATACTSPQATTLPPRGMGLAHYTLDLKTLPLPSAGPSNPFLFYVVVDPDNKIPDETHEWHQPTVVLTPDAAFDPGDQVCVEVQGTSNEKICYTVRTGADEVPQGLTDAINASQTAKQYGLTATKIKFDSANPTESARVIAGAPHIEITPTTGVAQLKPGTEPRAGFLDPQGHPFYFVPATNNLTATNDRPGQNNEGYGARTLTVSVPTTAGLLGGGDPCGGSSDLDLNMASDSLAAIDRDGTVHTGRVQVLPGQPLRLQFTAYADDDSPTCEQVHLSLGDPAAGGQHLATRFISGVDAVKGGRAWHEWRAPDKPGLYTLHARVHERPTDAQVGNNFDTLEVLVLDPTNPNGAVLSKFKGQATHVGSGQANGQVSLSGTVEFPGTLDLSTATLTLAQLLNEAGGNGELVHGANGANLVPLILQARPGSTATKAAFETPSGAEPKVEVEVNQQDPEKGVWKFKLMARRALIEEAAGCEEASSVTRELTTQFTLSDGTHFPLTIAKTQPWRCKKGGLKTP